MRVIVLMSHCADAPLITTGLPMSPYLCRNSSTDSFDACSRGSGVTSDDRVDRVDRVGVLTETGDVTENATAPTTAMTAQTAVVDENPLLVLPAAAGCSLLRCLPRLVIDKGTYTVCVGVDGIE